MDQITEFLKYQYKSEWTGEAKKLREGFTSTYTTDTILNLTQREYYFPGNRNTFSYRLKEDLVSLASMGNAYPSVFGAYVDSKGIRKLNPSLQKVFGENYDAALQYQKQQIVSLIKAGKEQNYTAIENSPIYQQLKFKILSVYYPDLYFPVCTKIALEAYCNVMGIHYDSEHSMLDYVLMLNKCSREHFPSDWTMYMAMYFMDWLWRNNKTFTRQSNSSVLKANTRPAIAESKAAESSRNTNDRVNLINELIRSDRKLKEEICNLGLEGKERAAIVKVRVNQSVFRDMLLSKYRKCCLCGVTDQHLLIASHIKPWSVCEQPERLDPNNGLLLCPNHDKLFDSGYIAFDTNMNVVISSRLSESDRVYMNISEDMSIDPDNKCEKYMKYHREVVFDSF